MSIERLTEIGLHFAPFGTLAVLLLLLVVLGFVLGELRRIRRRAELGANAVGEQASAVVSELRLLRNAIEEVGPMRYAIAGLLAVRREHRLETADIRGEVAEILQEWQEIDQAVGAIGETINKVRAQAGGR